MEKDCKVWHNVIAIMTSFDLKNIKPSDLPAPPQTALQIMQACGRKRVNTEELSRLTSNDPLLTAELLRVANSALFSHGREINTIQRAIQFLGQQTLRNLALCLAIRDALADCQIPDMDLSLFWEDALRRAVAARQLGMVLGLDGDECFTAGLLQDFGLLVLMQLNPTQGKEFSHLRQLTPEQRLRAEQKIFTVSHDQVVAMLAENWGLPPDLLQGLARHHQKGGKDHLGPLAWVLQGADWLCALFVGKKKEYLLKQCTNLLTRHYHVAEEQVEEFLATIPDQTAEAAQALGLGIGNQVNLQEIMRAANLRLIEDNLSYQQLTWRLKKVIRDRDRLAAELRKEMRLAQEVQQSLLPQAVPGELPAWGMNIAARQLSGDFYDFFSLGQGRMAFCLGDVSGKGPHAALLMAKTSALFRCLGKMCGDPAQLLTLINDELASATIRGMFVTMVAGVYTCASHTVELANAGHPPPLCLNQQGEITEFPAQAPPLGIVLGQQFNKESISLANGVLYLYSDGVIEGNIGKDKPLGEAGLRDHLRSHRGQLPRIIMNRLMAKFQHFPLHDDVTMLAVGQVCRRQESSHG